MDQKKVIELVIDVNGKEGNATIRLTDENIRELYKSFKYGKAEVNGLTTAISQGFNNAREIMQGFREVYDFMKRSFGGVVEEYQAAEQANIQLLTAMQRSGNYTEEAYNDLLAYSAELQRTTIYTDDATTTVMAQLQAMGLNTEQTKEATLQAANLAAIMETDLNGAARAMADLFQGNVGMIGRYIKGLDETIIKSGDLDKIIAMLNERIGGQAEAVGNSAVGSLKKMSNTIGDLKENAGELLTRGLNPIFSLVSSLVGKLNEVSPTLSGIIGLIATLTTALVTLQVTGIAGVVKSIITGIIPALTALKTSLITLQFSLGPVGWLTLGLTAIAGLWYSINEGQEKAAASLKKYEEQFKLLRLKEIDAELNKGNVESTRKFLLTKERENILQEMLVSPHSYNEGDITKNKPESGRYTADQQAKIDFEVGAISLEQYKKYLSSRLSVLKGATYEEKRLIVELRAELEKLNEEYQTPATAIEFKSPADIILEDVQRGDTNEYARLSAEQELDIWYDKELEKVSMYENSEEMMFALSEEYDRRKRELNEESAMASLQVTGDLFNNLSQFFSKHTAAYKLFSLFGITADTIHATIAAYKSTAAIPIVGPTLAPFAAAAAALFGASKYKELDSKQIPAYGRGGAIVGDHGIEIITPAQDYAQGWAQIITQTKLAVENNLRTTNASPGSNLEKYLGGFIDEVRTWQRELSFRLSGEDLVTGYDRNKHIEKGLVF